MWPAQYLPVKKIGAGEKVEVIDCMSKKVLGGEATAPFMQQIP